MTKSFLERTYNHFEKITDPRINRGENHSLIEMIFVALCATICGADSWVDVERYGKTKLDWLRKFIKLDNGVPSNDTFGRVFARLDSIEFYAALQSWVSDIAGSLKGETVAFDGKTLRGLLRAELWSEFWPNCDCRDLRRFSGGWPNCPNFGVRRLKFEW